MTSIQHSSQQADEELKALRAKVEELTGKNQAANSVIEHLEGSVEVLRAKVEELTVLNHGLQNRNDHLDDQLAAALRVTFDPKVLEQMNAMEKQLAAAQAREQQLREAILDVGHSHDCVWHGEVIKDACTPCDCGYAVLALPQDDTALKQYGAKLLLEEANKAERHIDYPIDEEDMAFNGKLSFLALHLRRMADGLLEGRRCELEKVSR